MRLDAALLALFFCLTRPVLAVDAALRQIPDARMVGEGKLALAFWDIYNASLYAPGGILQPDKAFVLSLRYMRDIEGQDIADRSVQEIRKQGFQDEIRLAAWNSQMKNIFPDVKVGTVLSAVFLPGEKTIFYAGERQIGIVSDAEFSRLFANIWLGEKTTEPVLRRKLLGLP